MGMVQQKGNFAFIDGTNLHLSTKYLSWLIDWQAFREYLRKRHNVTQALYFVGYSGQYEWIYKYLRSYDYRLVHKPLLRLPDGSTKGNCDTELVLHAMIELDNYDKAVIVTGDGDMGCLVKYLNDIGKFKLVIACKRDSSSYQIRRAAGGNIMFIDYLREKFEFIKK